MKKSAILFALIFAVANLFGQIDYCSEVAKAIDAASGNFISNTGFQFYTQNGMLAYSSGFSFNAAKPGFVYKDSIGREVYFYQIVSADPSDFQTFYSSVEACLVKERDHWTKLNSDDNNAVLFSCDKNGVEISIFKSASDISIQIERDDAKSIPVLNNTFCSDLQMLITSCNNDFDGIKTGEGVKSSFGTSYKSNIKLNQRNPANGTIEIAQDLFDKSKKANTYTEIFSNDDISWSELITALESCLTTADGWVKTQNAYNTGFNFTKNSVTVSITTGQLFPTDAATTHVISVKSS